jgi:DedD protein
MADEGFHEIQLSGKHLVALFMAATVVAVVIFLCGVMVGRDVQKQRVALAAAAAEPPPDPTAAARPSPPPPADAPAGSPQTPPSTARETLTYPERLSNAGAAPESLKAAPAPAPERTSPPPPTRPAAVESGSSPAEPAGAGFAVQVAAVADRSEADTIARRLAGKGYPAFVMAPAAGSPRMFRVRIGKYRDRREAERVAARLQREEQFKPWVTR